MTPGRRAAAVLLAVTATLGLASCAPEPGAAPADPSSPTAGASAPPVDPNAEPTCETILSESLIAEFKGYGLEAIEEPFSFGDPATTSIEGGVMCTWGAPDVATDHGVQIFGWAPLDAAGAEKWQAFLTEQGWTRSDEGGLAVYTEPFAPVPEDAMAYAFGDGFVKVAAPKQNLAVITWP
ncbi:hypothetical protein B5M43_001575 [Microbacterium sp. MEC084]|uniref:hypothetical protein n=1 Tax=Microbacterium sp. MEC084 TaxID=1963027 RepID=UPI00106F69E9|nr:hypothetical protein [Microbacterium sp. MEC084]MCD1267543.1 hypothetical protein [Microbacterium sp. MEC084]